MIKLKRKKRRTRSNRKSAERESRFLITCSRWETTSSPRFRAGSCPRPWKNTRRKSKDLVSDVVIGPLLRVQ
jgi:hypothetical protein